jgi:outer membrane protein TolC
MQKMARANKRMPILLWVSVFPILFFGSPLTAQVLSPEAFLAEVLQHHPVAREARLWENRALNTMLQARGQFDPKLGAQFDQKWFGGKNYYSVADGGIKWASPLAVEVKAGFMQSEGLFLNPEEVTPSTGLPYAGIRLPLGQDLLIDQRRQALQQARIFRQSAQVERLSMLNQLLYDAAQVYWRWFEATNQLSIFVSASENALERFQGIKASYRGGDHAPIDTVEALIQVQILQNQQRKAQVDRDNALLEVFLYRWQENGEPLPLNQKALPVSQQDLNGNSLAALQTRIRQEVQQLVNQHPDVKRYEYKIAAGKVDRRYYQNKLLPKLNLQYNWLQYNPNTAAGFNLNNYKWGLDFSIPIFLRAERGALGLANVKLAEAQLDLSFKRKAQETKLQQTLNELSALLDQVTLFTSAIRNYQTMLRAEEDRFANGESSMFLVNSRQQKLVEAQTKAIELSGKYFKTLAGLQFASATFLNAEGGIERP